MCGNSESVVPVLLLLSYYALCNTHIVTPRNREREREYVCERGREMTRISYTYAPTYYNIRHIGVFLGTYGDSCEVRNIWDSCEVWKCGLHTR